MITGLFLKGCFIGFSIAMPVGPIAMLCIRHALLRGAFYGLVAGMGAALADTFYGILAGCGMTLICEFLSSHQLSCQLMGGAFLVYLGLSTLKAKPHLKTEEKTTALSFSKVFLTTFLLTLTNPLTILGFMGVYAALGVGLIANNIGSAALVVSGIFMGSMTWWLILSVGSSLIGKTINFQSTRLLNQISGTAFLAFGVLTALAALNPFSLF